MTAPEPVEIVEPLTANWELGSSESSRPTPANLAELSWIPASVPGTVAGAHRAAGTWRPGQGLRFDDAEHWFRCRFESAPVRPGEQLLLRLEGLATLTEVWLNGQRVLEIDSMFGAHDIDVNSLVGTTNELAIVCRALTPFLAKHRRKQPLGRWRTRVVTEQQLRWFRTTILGRAPGFAPEPEPVGPWRPVSLVRRRLSITDWHCGTSLQGTTGVVEVTCNIAGQPVVNARLQVGTQSSAFVLNDQHATARLLVDSVKPWWPHTHGDPVLYPSQASFTLADGNTVVHQMAPVGFRYIGSGVQNPTEDGLALHVNGVPIFARGVVWTPLDPVTLQSSADNLRARLTLLRDGGMNLIRVVGTAWYEDAAFHGLCDELGMLVWQDMMFANMDYPFGEEAFLAKVTAEAETQCRRLAKHPSTAVLCGNSEIEQQASMLGLAPDAGRSAFFGEQLPAIVVRHLPGIPYLPSAPCGGTLPFRTNQGVANYFGVGAYQRPLTDARLAEVRFASECLAFSNVPEPEAIDEMAATIPGGVVSPTHPVWKRGVPRDAGVGWDFEDVRDHYLKLLYGVDPIALRYASTERYFELSRLITGELMAHVFGEWRRAASPCNGGIILWCNDLAPGAGWGIIDSNGRPKAAYWFLKRALAPMAIWMTDEGLNGVDMHVANDGPAALRASVRVALYQHGERHLGEATIPMEIAPHTTTCLNVEAALGHFADASYAYRFGLPGHDVIAASLSSGNTLLSQAFHFPTGRDVSQTPIERLGISGSCRVARDGELQLSLTSKRCAWGIRLAAKGCAPEDQYFSLEAGIERTIKLRMPGAKPSSLSLTAANAEGRLVIPVEPPA